ncbi:MAG: hypothetical protein UT05_C0001G0045 [Parcubacteria group bacterium GW2011_GWF2_38_76]|nr:MAG: hypothetical protein UT05_C0001G0045 [Parcubacteria group bacterium GW2011_GWF2_38_76]HBM45978.1 hypothetical protein [Patescibacteria group bacterium]
MKKIITAIFTIVFVALTPLFTFAHQPRIVSDINTTVTEPEISQAFYGKLEGLPHFFKINSEEDFNLYVNILTPDIEGQKNDVSAIIVKDGDVDNPIATLDGNNFKWEKFWEEFGYNSYWRGPEYKATVVSGNYEILIWSRNNDSKYSLAIGETESFDLKGVVGMIGTISKLKKNFFNEFPANFIFSPIGISYIIIIFISAFIFGFILRIILSKIIKNQQDKVIKNINKEDRIIRASLGGVLFIFAIFTTWNPFLIFLAGFLFFEAIIGWCGIYLILGKNTHTKIYKMKFSKDRFEYLQDNPNNYWFKRKTYGWGWYPATWQGWLVTAMFIIFIIFNGINLESDITPTKADAIWFFSKSFCAVLILIVICYKKGESPKWQWGLPKDDK